MTITKLTYISGIPLTCYQLDKMINQLASNRIVSNTDGSTNSATTTSNTNNVTSNANGVTSNTIQTGECARVLNKFSKTLETVRLMEVFYAVFGYRPQLTDKVRRDCHKLYQALMPAVTADVAKWGLTFKQVYHDVIDNDLSGQDNMTVAVIGMELGEQYLAGHDDRTGRPGINSMFNLSAGENKDITRLKLAAMLRGLEREFDRQTTVAADTMIEEAEMEIVTNQQPSADNSKTATRLQTSIKKLGLLNSSTAASTTANSSFYSRAINIYQMADSCGCCTDY